MIWPRLNRPLSVRGVVVSWDPGTRTGCAISIDTVLQAVFIFSPAEALAFARRLPREGINIIEMPDHNQGVPETDIFILSARGGELREATQGQYVSVKQWKGNASKRVTQDWATDALTPAELALVKGKANHAWDAVAINKWYCRKLGNL